MARQQHLEETWARIQKRLRTDFSESTYQIWLAALQPVTIGENVLYVRAPGETMEWVRRRFGMSLTKAASEVDPSIRRIELLTPNQILDAEASTPLELSNAPRDGSVGIFKPRYTFDRFVIGPTNRFAHAAALAAAELPGHAYNPLVVYGPPGVGKTHLLQAIGNYVATHDSHLTVQYATVEGFTADFTRALKHSKLDGFKRTYRHADVLLLDDLQFLEGKKKTTEELFHTLDSLMTSGGQIVVSSDRAPSRFSFLDARLRERLEAGLAIDLQPPDRTTRRAILHKLVDVDDVDIDPDVVQHLADRVDWNVRALEGAVIRIVAFASLSESKITLELVEQVLGTLYHEGDSEPTKPRKRPTADQIHHATAVALDLPPEDLLSTRRSRAVVYARHIAMYLCRELAGLSFPEIARHFQRRDHTTALHAHRKMKAKALSDFHTRSLLSAITNSLSTSNSQDHTTPPPGQSPSPSHTQTFSTDQPSPTTTNPLN